MGAGGMAGRGDPGMDGVLPAEAGAPGTVGVLHYAVASVLVLVLALVLAGGPRRAAPLPCPGLAALQAAAEATVAAAVAGGSYGEGPLAAACRDALDGGKRLRGAIVLEMARAAGARPDDAAPQAVALACEELHAASLVVDDLPDFDDDQQRRGRPSVWAAHGRPAAHMAAVALVAAAYQRAALAGGGLPPAAGSALCAELGRALGSEGIAQGQLLDTAHGLTLEEARQATRLKTAPLFELAVVAGWLAAGGALEAVPALRQAGRAFGQAYQYSDDLADLAGDVAAGRGAHNHAARQGAAAAAAETEDSLARSAAILRRLGLYSRFWSELHLRVAHWE